MAKSSSRVRPPCDSTLGFCQGDPGSMQLVLVLVSRHQSRSALAVSSGPLSQRTKQGQRPRCEETLSKQATVASASIEESARSARDSRVNSSSTCRILILRPEAVTSKWKSRAHTWSGRCARNRLAGVAEALSFAALGRHPESLLSPQALDFLAVLHRPALALKHRMASPVPPTGVGLGEAPKLGPQASIRVRLGRLVALGGSVLADDLTSPPLRNAKLLSQQLNCSAPLRRAHHFPG